MWWKLSTDVFNMSPILELMQDANNKQDGKGASRILTFLRMLSSCVDDCQFDCAESVSIRYGITQKQAERVWSVAIDKGVLRPVEGGRFSALAWMRENKLVCEQKAERAQREERAQRAERAQMAERAQISERPQIANTGGNKRDYCKGRVFLLAEENDALIREYGEDMAHCFYERLSSYKEKSGKQYSSDYAAIRRWVIDAVQKEAQQHPEQDGPTCNFQAYKTISSDEAFKIGHGGRTREEQAEVDEFNKSEKAQEYRMRLQKLIESKR